MIRPALVDLNPVELNYYPLMISLFRFNGSCNVVDDLSRKYVFPIITHDW